MSPLSIFKTASYCRRSLPVSKADEILASLDAAVKIRIVDFHAELTSKKMAMGWYFDGRVSAVLGTHTHIPTADTRILPYDSVIGSERTS